MGDRHFYGPDGDYRGRSTDGPSGVIPGIGLIVGLVALAKALDWWNDFLHADHPQPYRAIAAFTVIAEVISAVAERFAAFTPTAYLNFNVVLKIILTLYVLGGVIQALRLLSQRLDLPKRLIAALIGVF